MKQELKALKKALEKMIQRKNKELENPKIPDRTKGYHEGIMHAYEMVIEDINFILTLED